MSKNNNKITNLWDQLGMIVVLIILIVGCSVGIKYFFSPGNLPILLLSISSIGIVSCSMLFCLASGNFDLSIGSICALSGVVMAETLARTSNLAVSIGAGLACGIVVGLINGVVVAKLKINPLIATLASMQVVRGLSYIWANGKSVPISDATAIKLGNGFLLGLPLPVWYCIFFFLLFGFLLQRTTFGRNTLAIGGNEEASRLAGIKVDRTKVIIFVVQGALAAFAGMVTASRLQNADPNISQGFELEVISGCVLGGVSLTGGVGTMTFVVTGVLIMGIVQNAMSLAGVPIFYQFVARGSILLAAVLFDQIKRRR